MKKTAQWNPMRFHLIALTLLLLATSLSACGQTPPQAPVRPTQSIGESHPFASGTVTDSPNEQTPKTLDSLEIAVSTGAMVKTTVTADGTVLTGNPDNPHRLTVFLDYDCLYCRRFLINDFSWIQRTTIKTHKLVVEHIFVPMTTDGTLAAKLALCAARLGKFPEADQWLATHPIDDAALHKQFVKALHLNAGQMQKCIAQKDLVAGNERRAAELQVTRVPFFVLGKSSWLGLLSREELTRMIEKELEEQG